MFKNILKSRTPRSGMLVIPVPSVSANECNLLSRFGHKDHGRDRIELRFIDPSNSVRKTSPRPTGSERQSSSFGKVSQPFLNDDLSFTSENGVSNYVALQTHLDFIAEREFIFIPSTMLFLYLNSQFQGTYSQQYQPASKTTALALLLALSKSVDTLLKVS